MEYFVLAVLFVAAIIVALFLIFKPVIEDKKVRKNVGNSDRITQHYCFLLHCTENETIECLSAHNVNDVLEYTFDTEALPICFNRNSTTIEHKLSFYHIENLTYLKVSRVKLMHDKSNIPIMINRFFIEKLAAEPIDYAAFEKIVCPVSQSDSAVNR